MLKKDRATWKLPQKFGPVSPLRTEKKQTKSRKNGLHSVVKWSEAEGGDGDSGLLIRAKNVEGPEPM